MNTNNNNQIITYLLGVFFPFFLYFENWSKCWHECERECMRMSRNERELEATMILLSLNTFLIVLENKQNTRALTLTVFVDEFEPFVPQPSNQL